MRHDVLARLLQDGVVLQDPEADLRAAAEHLASLGLVALETTEFVRCADPLDADFPRSNRMCPGEVALLEGDADDEFRCPQCGRLVFPEADGKRRHRQLRAELLREGVLAYLRSLLADAIGEAEEVAAGVLRAPLGAMGTYVCLVDACPQMRFVSRDWARTQPTCYIVADPRLVGRFLQEEWLHRVALADLVAGTIDLAAVVMEAAESGSPAVVQNVSVPVCAVGVPPITDGVSRASQTNRCYVVEMTDDRVLIEGEAVMAAQADTRYLVFRLVWERFVDDLREGRAPEQFRSLDLATIIKELTRRAGRPFLVK
jgi:hypothetical protein